MRPSSLPWSPSGWQRAIWVLHETLPLPKLIGCALILGAVLLISISGGRRAKAALEPEA